MGKVVSEIKCPTCNSCKSTTSLTRYNNNLYWGLLHSLDTGHEVEAFIKGKLILKIDQTSYTGPKIGFLAIFGLEYKGGLPPLTGGRNDFT